MQVSYSGATGRVPRYHCVRGRDLHGTGRACQGVGGIRLDKTVATAFLDAVSSAGVAAAAGAVEELEAECPPRPATAGARAGRVRGGPGAAAVRRLRARGPPRRAHARARYEQALAEVERERGKLAALEQTRPAPLSKQERRALARLARDLPRLWNARRRATAIAKELLRALIREIVVTVERTTAHATVEIFWEGGARSELSLRLNRSGFLPYATQEDVVTLIRRLAAHHRDREIAIVLKEQGRKTGRGLPFTERRVKHVRQRHGIPIAPAPDPVCEIVTINEAARQP
jgi:hypothetical protein